MKLSSVAQTVAAGEGMFEEADGDIHPGLNAEGEEGLLLTLPDGQRVRLPEERIAEYRKLFKQYKTTCEEAKRKNRPFRESTSGSFLEQVAQARVALRDYRVQYALEDAGVTVEEVAEALTPTEEAPERLEVPAALQFTRQVEVLEGGLVAVDMWVAPAVEAEETVVGATLSQRFPGGWEMVEAEPGASVYSPKEHVVKWLVQSAVTTPVNIRFVVRPTSEQAKAQDWQMLPAWVLFRQAGEVRRLLVGGVAL